MSYLITQSLIASWMYIFSAHEGGEEAAMESFARTLNREPSEQTDAMRRGIEFEAQCYEIARKLETGEKADDYSWAYHGAAQIAEIIKGGQYQVRLSRSIEVDGTPYLLYGVLDALKAGVIYDIKYKSKSFGSLYLPGSYLDSPQHPAYLYLVPESTRFEYLVSDGVDLYTESYTRESAQNNISEIIRLFANSIDSMGLTETYRTKWQAR